MPLDELIREAEKALGVTVLGPLRRGGQKAVLRATTPEGETVALKVAELAGPHAALMKERAIREVDLLRSITSPCVVKVMTPISYLPGNPEGVAWLEELLPGRDLGDALSRTWDWPATLRLLAGVAEGLAAFHGAGVVHRDLSAGNVRQIAADSYKLIDPGLARHLSKATVTGIFQPGTPGYMSPEHVNGTRPIAASDVFSAGILAYQALTGSVPVPFRGDFDEYAKRLAQVSAQPLSSARPDLPDSAIALVTRCLDRQSARRFLDGTELLDAVRGL